MKVLIYHGDMELVEKSGIGMAVNHQIKALQKAGVDYTTDESDDYDIVHVNTIFAKSYLFSRMAKRRGKKVIYYGHSTMDDFRNSFTGSNLVAPLFKWWITKCYNSGHIVITPTEYSKSILETYRIHRPIYAVSNGIDLDFFRRSEEARKRFREKYGIGPEEKVVVSVGHFIERKGLDDFVEVARALPQYRFMWFGYTNPALITPKIRDAMKSKPDNLEFPGYVNQEQLRDAYVGSDIFLFMTHEETEGIVLLEALGCEIPILVRDIEIYETIPDGEIIYKASDIPGFVKRTEDILEGRVPSLVEPAYQFVRDRSIQHVGQELKEIYKKLLSSNRRKRKKAE